ncbi:MAG: oxidoreductase, partial [Syntrophobacterales bacterium CG03_land_8_20_14_0_80_58_14]
MKKPVRVGIVGAGFSASFHLRSYRQVKEIPVEIAAIAGKTREHAEQLAGRCGIPKV